MNEKFEKTRHLKNNDKSKKYILRGERNVRYYDRILSNEKKSYNVKNFIVSHNFFESILGNKILQKTSLANFLTCYF